MGIDLSDGVVMLMMNQVMMSNMTMLDTKLRDTKPHDLKERLQFGDYMWPDWRVIQSESSITNVHVYSRVLTFEEMIQFTGDKVCSQNGDYLAWDTMEWKLYGNASLEATIDGSCENHIKETQQFLINENFSWQSCMDLCPKMQQGEVPSPENLLEISSLMNWAKQIDSSVLEMWVPFTDEEKEDSWVNFYTRQLFTSEKHFRKNQPNGGRLQNCMTVRKDGFEDVPCDDGIIVNKCPCKFNAKPILKLRGLCPKSYLDQYYTLYQGNQLAFNGLSDTKIEYNAIEDVWEANIVTSAIHGAVRIEAGNSMILGRHIWAIRNDSRSCNEGKPYNQILKMTGCKDNEFTCRDGQCILMSKRCDQIGHCKDKSDELECMIVKKDKNYNKQIPPFDENNKAKVQVSMTFLSINDISEIDLTIDIKFTISMNWYETERVIYYNLKPKLSSNVLSTKEMKAIWTPYIVYTNTDDNEATKVDHKFKDIKSTIAVTREGNFSRSTLESVDEIELYKEIV